MTSISQNPKGVSANSRPFSIMVKDSNSKFQLLADLTKAQFDILGMIVMKPNSRTRYTTRPYDYSTSFCLVDDSGQTVMHHYYSKRLRSFVSRPKTIPLRINKTLWMKYREMNRQIGIPKTDCSIIRGFYIAFKEFNHKPPSQETMRYFIERIVNQDNVNFVNDLRFESFGEPQDDKEKSTVQDKQINIHPVIRKEPSQLNNNCLKNH